MCYSSTFENQVCEKGKCMYFFSKIWGTRIRCNKILKKHGKVWTWNQLFTYIAGGKKTIIQEKCLQYYLFVGSARFAPSVVVWGKVDFMGDDQLLKANHKKARLEFAIMHIDKPQSFWENVLWTDESKLELFAKAYQHFLSDC